MPNALRLPQLAIGPELPRTLRETYAETLRAAEITYRGAKADRQAWPMLVRSFLALGLLSGCVTTNTLGDPCAAGDLSSGKGQEGSCGRDRDPALWSDRLHIGREMGHESIGRSTSDETEPSLRGDDGYFVMFSSRVPSEGEFDLASTSTAEFGTAHEEVEHSPGGAGAPHPAVAVPTPVAG